MSTLSGREGVIFLSQMLAAVPGVCMQSRPGPRRGPWWATPGRSLLQERIFLTLSNYVFTAVFLAEMTVKVMGELALVRGCLVPGGGGEDGPQWRAGLGTAGRWRWR